MKAALLEDLGRISVLHVDTPVCREGEVLVKVEACGICRTDMKCFVYGQRDLHLPRILGHEIAGTVVETGPGVTVVKAGDRVQVAPGIPCGECKYCLNGMDHLCDRVQVMGFHYHGGFAEYVLVPAKGVKIGALNLIPEHLTFAEAALTEPLACSVNMQESLQVGRGDRVLIFGAGPLGILNAKLARVRGAETIVLVETNEKRRLAAEKREFDYCLNSLTDDLSLEIQRISGGRGIDVVIPCCPGAEPFNLGLNLLGKRGRFGFFSGLILDSPLETDINMIHYKELAVRGAYGCSSRHNKTALGLLGSGQVSVKDMITKRLALDDVQKGLEMVKKMSETSIIVEF